jgi:UDP-N-acetylmuramate--alanine ligase
MVREALWPAIDGLPDLRAGDRVLLVGVAGAGMSGLSRALLAIGLEVWGCDRDASPMLADLADEGVHTLVGHSAKNLPQECRLVIHTPAVGMDAPELAAAQRLNIPITKRAVLLGALMDRRYGIAVAGTHGKTTTSGLMAYVLETAGLDPSYFVGGVVPELGSNAHLGEGPHLVLEADEYDRSFLNGHPALAIITNVEHDHPDIYPDEAALDEAFAAFATRVRSAPEGLILVNAAWPKAMHAVQDAAARVETYRVENERPVVSAGGNQGEQDEAVFPDSFDWYAKNIRSETDRTHFEVLHQGDSLGTFQIGMAGAHNVSNALAVIAAAKSLNVEDAALREALERYQGAGRRFEPLGEVDNILVIDDYAHHPTEIRATIEGARLRFPGRRIIAVVEPHTYSRVRLLLPAFRSAVETADLAIVSPIFAAREAVDPEWTAEDFAAGLDNVQAAESLEDAADRCTELAKRGDLLIFMGAGAIQRAGRRCYASLFDSVMETLADEAANAGLKAEATKMESLAGHTSLRVGGPADLLVRARELNDLEGWWKLAQSKGIPGRVLGRGTNVLVRDGGMRGLVIVNRCEGWSLESDASHPERAIVRCESGVTLAALAHGLARQGWAGIEEGVGIPGSVGAGVVTNAGAHGWEICDSLVAVELIDGDGQLRWLEPSALAFRYRGSMLKGRDDLLVRRVDLALERDRPETILRRIETFSHHRRETQPREPSVGSVFKNPEGDFAGRLIEMCQLKGASRGGAQISPKHANFVINAGGAKAADIAGLIETARRDVQTRFGLQLETEIEIMGVEDDVA